MGLVSKAKLVFNTVKFLKLKQIINQVFIRLRPKERFEKYYKSDVKYNDYRFWAECLDAEEEYCERFRPDELLDDRLTLLHDTVLFNRWHYSDKDHLWNFNVHYLEYLVPLASKWKKTGEERYRNKLNDILSSWYQKGSREDDSNQPYTISMRIVNLLVVADSVDDKRALFNSIYAQYRFLLNHQEKHLLGNHYFENLKAIVICSLVFGENNIYEKYIRKLISESQEEITEDGLHYEMSLMYHKIILEDLIRVASALRQAKKPELHQITDLISKMLSALFSLEYGINRTPLFNDAGNNVSKSTAALLETCRGEFGITPQKKDTVSGYYKLYDGKLALIVDCGELAPSYMPGHAHCDCLSFELYYDGEPLITNSGTFQYQGNYRNYYRATEAHNTVLINDHQQSELWGEHRCARRLIGIKGSKKANEIIGEYRNYLGEKHQRIIMLKNSTLSVVDKTEGTGKSFLHLAPSMHYKDGVISGMGMLLKLKTRNAISSVEKTKYAYDFGWMEDNDTLVFCWNCDEDEHGYEIEICKGD